MAACLHISAVLERPTEDCGMFLLQGPSRAKQQFEDAMQRMIDKRNAVDDAAFGQAPSN